MKKNEIKKVIPKANFFHRRRWGLAARLEQGKRGKKNKK